MDIVMPIAQFQLGWGGAEMQAHKLATALIARGHRVTIVSTRPRGQPAVDDVEGVTVRRLFSFGNLPGVWRLAPYAFSALLVRELMRGDQQIVHAHQAFHAAWAAVLARRRGGAPVIVKVATAGVFGDLAQMRARTATLPLGSAQMLRTILDGADMFVAISGAVADELAAAGVEAARIARIPNGVAIPQPLTPEKRARLRAELGVGDEPVVLYVGRSEPQKGVDLVARAWPTVAVARPDARLWLLGHEVERVPEVQRIAAVPRVEIRGRVRDVSRHLAAADLLVLPSRGEGLSNAVLEAMAAGLPCLVSDLPANRELVDDGRLGFLTPGEDADALGTAIVAALADRPRALALAALARRRVEAEYGIDLVAARYESLYESLRR
jgi:glycosyltransferase involved in cell wall biosynthesis